MTGPERIYRGELHTGRVVYQDVPPDEAQAVWPWCEYVRADLAPDPAAIVRAALEAAADSVAEYLAGTPYRLVAKEARQGFRDAIRALAADPQAVARIIGEARNG